MWGGPIGILQHLWCSLVFREPSVDQEDKKDAPEPRRHSTGKRRFLSFAQIHTPTQRFCAVFFKYPVSVCFLTLCTPGRQMRLSWRRLKEGSASQSELFPEESRYVRRAAKSE